MGWTKASIWQPFIVHRWTGKAAFHRLRCAEIDNLLFRPPSAQQLDILPPLPDHPVTLPGDVWLCGENRVLCGDATSAEDVDRMLESRRPGLMITDPPYGVAYDPLWREQAGLGQARQVGRVTNDDRVDWSAAYHLFSGDVAYVWHAGVHAAEVGRSLQEADFDLRSQIIWAKQHFVLSRGHYHWQHEPCWYAVRRGNNAGWCGDRSQSTLWETPNLNPFGGGEAAEGATGHGTQKPLELIKRPILNHTQRGESVYDPFLRSGTTLIAAHVTERICYSIEIEPAYVDMALARWQKASGRPAVLAGSGQSFEQLRSERLPS